MTDIEPATPEALLASTLPAMNVAGEIGEHCYYDDGSEQRHAAVISLLAADAENAQPPTDRGRDTHGYDHTVSKETA